MYCRELTERFEDVWIVSGPLTLPQTGSDGKKTVSYQVGTCFNIQAYVREIIISFCIVLFRIIIFKNIYLFICLHWALVAACRISSCGRQGLVLWPGTELRLPALGAQSLSHWTTREVSVCNFLVSFIHKDLLSSWSDSHTGYNDGLQSNHWLQGVHSLDKETDMLSANYVVVWADVYMHRGSGLRKKWPTLFAGVRKTSQRRGFIYLFFGLWGLSSLTRDWTLAPSLEAQS